MCEQHFVFQLEASKREHRSLQQKLSEAENAHNEQTAKLRRELVAAQQEVSLSKQTVDNLQNKVRIATEEKNGKSVLKLIFKINSHLSSH